MRTFLGLLIGGFLGGLTGGFSAAVGGAILGALIARFAQRMPPASPADPLSSGQGGQSAPERIAQLERKAQYLYEQLQSALKRIDTLEAAAGLRMVASEPAGAASAAVRGAAPDAESGTAPDAVSAAPPDAVDKPAENLAPIDIGPLGVPLPTQDLSGAPADEAASLPAAANAPTFPAQPQVAEPASREPGLPEKLFGAAREWFTGGNTVVRVGVVVLFFGLAFLLKYAYEHTSVPPELRILAVAIGGVVLLALGWKLRGRRAAYGQALQGGGVGVLYLTLFAAYRLYDLLPSTYAFALMICVAVLSAALAVLQNAQALALLGASGGFLAPILASTGEGSHVALFGYYTLLNAGLLAVAWFKAWRVLNWTGFIFTFGIGLLWGARYYQPDHYATTQPFLMVFYAFYLAMSVLFALRQAPRLKHYLDGTLIFGLPVVGFGMQSRLVADLPYGAAFSALVLALVYLALGRLLYARHRDDLRALVEVFLALGVVFATLAIPLALDGRWTSAAWALEGAALLWLGIKQERLSARLFGLVMQGAAVGAFLVGFEAAPVITPVANSFFLGALFLSVSALFSNVVMERAPERLHAAEKLAATFLFWWGVLWWAVAGLGEIERQVPPVLQMHVALLFVTVSCAAFSWLHGRLAWRLARFPMMGLLPAGMLTLAGDHAENVVHPLAHLGWLAWPVLMAAHLRLMRTHEAALPSAASVLHAAGVWLFAGIGAWELSWWIDQEVGGSTVWGLIAWAIVPAGLLWVLVARGEKVRWPIAGHLRTYLVTGGAPLAVFLGLWLLYSNVASDGDAHPLPYIPLLTPLDLMQGGVLLALVYWMRGCRRLGLLSSQGKSAPTSLPLFQPAVIFYAVLGALAFICANGVLLRTVHHWAGVPFDFEQMMASMLVQASLSIFWTVLALSAMVIASRLGRRALWMVGAAMMAVVVVKLFLVDLSAISGVERIVSFIGVGVLMLVVGYFSPVPPKRAEGLS